MNVAFKHLEAKLRFGELTIGQWAAVVGGLLFGLVFAQYLSPVGGVWGMVLGIYLGAIPASAAFFASLSEFDLGGLLGAALRGAGATGATCPARASGARLRAAAPTSRRAAAGRRRARSGGAVGRDTRSARGGAAASWSRSRRSTAPGWWSPARARSCACCASRRPTR